MSAPKRIKQECPACSGTGLYSGFAEAPGEAVVCQACEGRAWVWHEYREFDGRKKKRGIKGIRLSRGNFLFTGVGGVGAVLSYAEFEKAFPIEGKPQLPQKLTRPAPSKPALKLVKANVSRKRAA